VTSSASPNLAVFPDPRTVENLTVTARSIGVSTLILKGMNESWYYEQYRPPLGEIRITHVDYQEWDRLALPANRPRFSGADVQEPQQRHRDALVGTLQPSCAPPEPMPSQRFEWFQMRP
jgi:hypothetical protein